MIQYARPTVDNLINNLPDLLKSSRQFLAWNVEAGEKKVPLRADGGAWGNYQDPSCWITFDHAIDLLDRRRAFGIGLVLPSPQHIETLAGFNLIPGLIAFDGDAKRSSIATPYSVPDHISGYIRSAQSYAEFSTSLMGLRALAFGDLPTHKQNLVRSFGDGTELSMYRVGWVTLSGLPYGDSCPTIEHRQDVVDQIVAELWPELKMRIGQRHGRAPSFRQYRKEKTSSWTGVAASPTNGSANSFRGRTEHPSSYRTSRPRGSSNAAGITATLPTTPCTPNVSSRKGSG
jgi:hypothetical protein